jgi:hypothetical protein
MDAVIPFSLKNKLISPICRYNLSANGEFTENVLFYSAVKAELGECTKIVAENGVSVI